MKAWIGAWSECRLQSVSKPEEGSRRICLFPAELQSEAVTILAGFALSVWQKEGRDDRRQPEGDQRASEAQAYLYVRQSTPRQVLENTESAKRQYALRQRAAALGWPTERIIVVDSDQGHSGASVADREGFQKLVGEVGMGRAGVVLGLEVSRLARNNADWHRLLEICALTDTLILDEDGVYDPKNFNDRLLLGLNRPDTQNTSCSTSC